jgi:hypothetical protein
MSIFDGVEGGKSPVATAKEARRGLYGGRIAVGPFTFVDRAGSFSLWCHWTDIDPLCRRKVEGTYGEHSCWGDLWDHNCDDSNLEHPEHYPWNTLLTISTSGRTFNVIDLGLLREHTRKLPVPDHEGSTKGAGDRCATDSTINMSLRALTSTDDRILFAPGERTFWRLHEDEGLAALPGSLATEHGCFEYGSVSQDFSISIASVPDAS